MSNTLGTLFRVTSFGESHGACIGVVVDGCPAGLPLSVTDLQVELDRRKPGAAGTTRRREPDTAELWSGVFNGFTTGAPLCMIVRNEDVKSADYDEMRRVARPGHSDFTARMKYGGFNDYRGGGRFSGRVTAGHVMAGAVAAKVLATLGIELLTYTVEIGGVKAEPQKIEAVRNNRYKNRLYCPDLLAAEMMEGAIEQAAATGDSIGGIIESTVLNVPAGLGEPVFDTVEGMLSRAMFAVPAVKGIEFGSGFEAARSSGSENNDPFIIKDGTIRTATNNAGGVLGGITTGMPIVFRVAVKPTPSISKPQQSVDMESMQETELTVRGRHDVCIVPRAVPVVGAMTAITLCDFALRAQLIPEVLR